MLWLWMFLVLLLNEKTVVNIAKLWELMSDTLSDCDTSSFYFLEIGELLFFIPLTRHNVSCVSTCEHFHSSLCPIQSFFAKKKSRINFFRKSKLQSGLDFRKMLWKRSLKGFFCSIFFAKSTYFARNKISKPVECYGYFWFYY
jgi:hypothetical protein